MQLRRRKRANLAVDLTPLIDVVFLMLIFFMVSTSFQVANSVKLDLPSSSISPEEPKEEKKLIISVDKAGQIYLQNNPVSDQDLSLKIKEFSAGRADTPVVLRADANATHKRVVFVLDQLRQLNMSKVGIATRIQEH
ncbi:MAG: biopolymer transporter ExbD [Mariprofundaceae bacterium]|nr:biopolymer transporter ExbD [Mariprofundaceae bacterium]